MPDEINNTEFSPDQYPYRIKGWHQFQHYKYRSPPWIKLHRSLLDDPEFHNLEPLPSKVLVLLWLIASDFNGNLPECSALAFRLRMELKTISSIISKLSHWIEHDASTMLAASYHDAIPEKSRVETEKRYSSSRKIDDGVFEQFWKAYPRKVGKRVAEKALVRALKEVSLETIIQAIAHQLPFWTDPKYIPHPATWLNGGRWADEVNGARQGQIEGILY